MKQQMNAVAIATIAAIGLGCSAATAESAAGYQSSGLGVVSATLDVDIFVTVPKVILLRVGPSGTPEDQIQIKGSIAGLVNGSNPHFAWSGAAPTFSVNTTGGFIGGGKTRAWAWTNSSAGGKVTCNAIGSGAAVAASLVQVATSNNIGGGLAHPGATTACGGTTNFAHHQVRRSDWQYSMTPAAMQSLNAGTHNYEVFYTATSL